MRGGRWRGTSLCGPANSISFTRDDKRYSEEMKRGDEEEKTKDKEGKTRGEREREKK